MIVYRILSRETGKSYVGQTIHEISWRWRGHVRSAIKCNSMMHIHCAIRKYGEDAFELSVLQVCSTQEELDAAEKHWIGELDSIKNGYNLAEGGRNSRVMSGENHPRFGKHLTSEHRAKIAASNLGKKMSGAACQRMSTRATGRKHSDETRAKITKGLTGRPCTEETRHKLREARVRRKSHEVER